jgi:gliding motility-associated-like protein
LIRKTYDETNEKQLNFCTQMKLYLVGVFCFLISYFAFNQSLIINEVSQGPSGSKEYVELLVIPSITNQNCETCMDLRGWIIDDNNGYFSNGNTSGTGVAAGAVRFSNDAIWSCVPFGTLIVIYNQADVNVAIPAQDVSLSDNNCRLILPVSSNLLEFQTVSPGSGNTTYPTSGWTTGGSLWSPLGMSNNDDSFQTYAPTNTLAPVFGVSWGNNNSNNIIYFAGVGGVSNTVFYFANTNSNDPFLQSNWLSGTCAAPDNQTPGLPNNPANAIYINQLNNSCQPILPITSTSVISDETCNCNGSVTITPTGGIPNYTYSWTNTSSIVIGQTATLSNLCAGTYSCEVTTSNGCTYDTTIVIPSNPNTTTPTFTQIGPLCVGDVFSLPTTSTNNIPGTWSPAPNFAQTTTYTFTPTNTSCPTNATMTVVVNPCGLNQETCFKTVTFTQVISSSCLVGVDTGDEDPALSIWCDNSLNNLLFGTEWTLNIPSANTYNLPNPWNVCQQSTNAWSVGAIPSDVQSLNVFVQTYESDDSDCENAMTSGDDCRSSANHTMDLTLGTHVIDIGGELSYRYTVTETTLVTNVLMNTVVCNGNTYDANLTVSYLNPNTPCGLGGTLGNLIVNGQQFIVTTSPQTITLTNLPADGQAVNINAFFDGDYSSCQYNATNVFTAPIPPTLVSLTGGGDYCTSETPNNVQVNVTGNTPFSATYTLDGVSNTVQSNTNPFSLGNLAGEYILTQITAGGCSTAVDDTVEITISSSISPNFTQIGPFCVGDVFTLPNTSTNGIQGVWSPAINSTLTTTYTFTPVNNNCSSTTTMEVVINSSVTPTFAPINPICINGTAPNLPTSSTNGISGTWSPSTISTTTAGNFNFIFSPSTGQCASVTSQNITITNPITPNLSAIGPFCINSTPTNLPNQSVEGVTGTWNPAIINTTTLGTSNYIFTPSSGFCATTFEAIIFIGDNSVNAGIDQTVCEGDTVTLSAQGTAPFLWNNGVDDNVPFVVNQTAIYTVSSTQNGCTATDNINVNVIQNPNVDFTFTPVTGNAPLSVVFSNQTINGTSYTWDFGNGSTQNINSALDVSQIYLDGGVYSITLYASNNGCVDSITYNLIVLPDPNLDFNVPNVFSPNNDLSNDVYSLNFENAKALNAIIVNRWGNLIYTFTSPLQTWDGTSNGIECPEGVYFVKYEVTAINNEIFKGQQFIHLIR